MVQLQLPEQEKAGEVVGEVAEGPLLPTHTQARTRRQATNKSSVFLVVLSLVFAVLTVKKICDLKEENLRLWQQLRLEMQKDTALKMAVRDNIPQTRFLGHIFTKSDVDLVESAPHLASSGSSSWTINLSVLWASPDISPCDMHQLSHVLAEEIYEKGVLAREARAWQDAEDAELENKVDEMIEELLQGEEEEYDSEESSEEDDIELGLLATEREYPSYPEYHEDYDYYGHVEGENDELPFEGYE